MNRRHWMHMLALVGLNLSAFAVEQSLGEVGVTAVNSKFTNTVVAISYADLNGGSDMIVSNLVKTANLTAGDTLAAFNDSKTYDTWVLTTGAGGVKYWAKQAKTYTVGADGQLAEGTGVSAEEKMLGIGTGIWLTRQNPTTASGDAVPFYLYGKPVSSKSVSVAADTWTLVGNPTQNDVTLDKEWMNNCAVNGDQVVMPGGTGRLWYYSYKKGKGWRTTKADGSWDSTPPVIGAGQGFWIRLTNGGTIEW